MTLDDLRVGRFKGGMRLAPPEDDDGDEELRTRLSVQARARACVSGWDRSAGGTLDVLREAAFAGDDAAGSPEFSHEQTGAAPSRRLGTAAPSR